MRRRSTLPGENFDRLGVNFLKEKWPRTCSELARRPKMRCENRKVRRALPPEASWRGVRGAQPPAQTVANSDGFRRGISARDEPVSLASSDRRGPRTGVDRGGGSADMLLPGLPASLSPHPWSNRRRTASQRLRSAPGWGVRCPASPWPAGASLCAERRTAHRPPNRGGWVENRRRLMRGRDERVWQSQGSAFRRGAPQPAAVVHGG